MHYLELHIVKFLASGFICTMGILHIYAKLPLHCVYAKQPDILHIVYMVHIFQCKLFLDQVSSSYDLSKLKVQFSKHRPSVSVCRFTFEVPLFPKSDVQTFQRFGIIGRKQWQEMVSDLTIFAQKWSNWPRQKNIYFLYLFTFEVLFKRLFSSTY